MKSHLLAFVFSAIFTVILGFLIIPLLRKLKIGQPILKFVSEHKGKSGTPTMGGTLFILGSAVAFFIFNEQNSRLTNLTLSVTLGFGIIGFLDDFIKIKLKRNEGLTPIQKFTFQTAISLIASYFAFDTGLNFQYLPFSSFKIPFGVFVIPINALVFVATVNSVNLTDGLDGLCASVSTIVFTALGVIILLQVGKFSSYINTSEYDSLALYCFAFSGALLGYLLFNTNKASVFMGDTGSLSIGGALSTIAILSGNTFYLPILGVFYMLSTISVIIQVAKFKRTGKRLFLMAPLHHHFQQKGYSESKISYVYTFITLIISAFAVSVYL